MASKKLGLDFSPSERKQFVRKVVESYLADLQSEAKAARQAEEEEPEEEDDEEGQRKGKRGGAKEYEDEDDGDLIICRLTDKRRVTITNFKGKTLVSIRQYYKKYGKELPTSKVQGN